MSRGLGTMLRFRVAIRSRMPGQLYGFLRHLLWHRGALKAAKLFSRSRSDVPPAYLTAQYGTASPERYMAYGHDKGEAITAALAALGRPLRQGSKLLDFGCGPGRVMQAFAGCHEVYGCDIRADAVRWLQDYRPWPVALTKPMPPLPATFSDFDLIYALSVFTHMPDEAARAWLAHLPERLSTRGALLVTVIDTAQKDFAGRFGVSVAGERFHYDRHKNITFLTEAYLRDASPLNVIFYGPMPGFTQYVAVLAN